MPARPRWRSRPPAGTSIATTVLLCWSAYASDTSKPKLEDIEQWNKELAALKKDIEQDPVTLAWTKRLKAYGFSHVDDFDLAIARVVERGYIDGTGFVELAKKYDLEFRSKDVSAPFSAVWRRFHDSFAGDQDVFIAELYDAALQAISQISPRDLNDTVQLLRELERDDLADDLIEKFVASNKANPSIFDLKEHVFGGSIDDAKLRTVFNDVHAGLTRLPGLKESVTFMIKKSGYNEEHLDAMKKPR